MGTIQAPPGVSIDIPAVLATTSSSGHGTNRQPDTTFPSSSRSDMTSLLMEKLILVLGWFRVQITMRCVA